MSALRYALVWTLVLLLSACASKQTDEEGAALSDAEMAPLNPLQGDFDQAVELMHQGKLDEARSQMIDLHKKDPKLTGPMLNLALVAVRLEKNTEAQDWLDKVLELVPLHPVALTYAGLIARDEGMFALAEQRYREALKGKHDYAPAVLNMAILLDMYRGRLGEALEYYERYQRLQETPNPKVEEWVFDLKQRIEASQQ